MVSIYGSSRSHLQVHFVKINIITIRINKATLFATKKHKKMAVEIDEEIWNQYMHARSELFCKRGKDDKEKPQARAFAFADTRGGLPVFGVQIAEKNWGYMAQGWESFFQDYKKTPGESRVYFEIIRERAPVNFYIDAELIRSANPLFEPGSEHETLILEETKRVCIEGLLRCFPHISKDEITIHEMDASDAKKLSRHYIFRIKGKALSDYVTAGLVYDDIALNIPKTSLLWITDDKDLTGPKSLFLDNSVYTKNRQFRIYQSRKFGSYRFLCVPGFDKPGDEPNLEMLRNTLITYFPPLEKKKNVLLELKSDGTKRKRGQKVSKGPKVVKKQDTPADIHWLAQELQSMFNDRVYGTIMDDDGGAITFWVESKVCEMWGGEHDGNHIQYLVNLSEKNYVQMCFARSCQGKSGKAHPIPEKYHKMIDKYMLEERDLSYLDNLETVPW
jgi:hypothetical protein